MITTSRVEVFYNLSDGKCTRRLFESPVTIDTLGRVGDELGSHSFNAYEDGHLLGGWAVFKDGWNFCGR